MKVWLYSSEVLGGEVTVYDRFTGKILEVYFCGMPMNLKRLIPRYHCSHDNNYKTPTYAVSPQKRAERFARHLS